MKRSSIYGRLLLSSLLFCAFALGLVLTFTQKYTQRCTEREESKRLYRESMLIATDYATKYLDDSADLSDFQKQMELAASYMSASIWIVDTQGKILVDSSDASVGRDAAGSSVSNQVIDGFRISDFGDRYYQIGDFYGRFSHDVLTVYSPITMSYKVHGYVLIHEDVSLLASHSDGYVNITFYSVLIVFAGFLLLMLYQTRAYFQPLGRITKHAEAYAKGDFSKKIEVKGHNEVAYLAHTLNYMASEMDQMKEEQRKFVSNVSHDFRSPLTSIRGYIEAILDGTIPTEFQERYLKIVLSETERLNKLTQSLLDLNQFGKHGVSLDLSDFDINQMIRSTILTFEGTCSTKRIQVDLILTGQELFVRADASKISQVLYNLIDNALKFSRSDTTVKIETNVKHGKVLVSVKDHGIGIPADSINKIWDRFYKTDASRGRDKKGSGLGLSIVKEIIAAHEENINCVSTEGAGTEFTFTLPLSHHPVPRSPARDRSPAGSYPSDH